MIEAQRGMVLLITVMMISLLTLFVLSLLQAVMLSVKVSHQVVKQHQSFYQLESVATSLLQITPVPACMLTNEDPNQIIALLSQQTGCSLIDNHRAYSYLIDDLGLQPCLRVISGHKLYSSHHWLFTIKDTSSGVTLQLRIAKPNPLIPCDEAEVRMINEGMISWRYLSKKQHDLIIS